MSADEQSKEHVQFKKRKKRKKVQFVANQILASNDHDDNDEIEAVRESDTDTVVAETAAVHPDALYDEHQDAVDEKFVQQKYSTSNVIQSDCTVCCANCFIFISYIVQKHKQRPNEYRCMTADNCTVDTSKLIKTNHYAVFCEQCHTELGTRETVADLASTSLITEQRVQNGDGEKEIWTLISSNLSPSQAGHHLKNIEQPAAGVSAHPNSKDNDTFVYHLSNVLPGMI